MSPNWDRSYPPDRVAKSGLSRVAVAGYTCGMGRSEQGHDFRGIIYVLVTLLGWSSVLLFLRHLHTYIDAWTANGWRYGMCAMGLFPLFLNRWARGGLPRNIWKRALAPAALNSIAQVCFGFSIYYIEPGLAGFLLRVALISSTFGAFVLFVDERMLLRSRLFWGGMLLVVAGSIGTVVLGVNPIRGGTLVGVCLGASAGGLFGLYGVSVRYFMRGVPSLHSFAIISSYTALAMVALMIGFGATHGLTVLKLAPQEIICLVLSAVLGIAIGHIFYYASIARLGVAISGAVVQLAPFLTGVAAIVVFGEILTMGQWSSGVIMLIGGGLLLRAEKSRRAITVSSGRPAFPVELEDAGDPGAIAAETRDVVEK